MRLALALALVLGAAPPDPQVQPAATAAMPDVTLDVVVDDARGKAVETLGPADFSVTEQAHPLTIANVRFVKTIGSASGVSVVPISTASDKAVSVADTRRLIAIFLDEFHVTPGAGAEGVRAALVRFVNEDLGPDDLVVVLKPLDSLLDIRLTSDRRAAVQAIESF